MSTFVGLTLKIQKQNNMKKLFLALAAVLFAACATDVTEDVAIEAPETLKVSFEESSRIQLQNGKTVWTEGDLVSVFYKSYENMKWKFAGKTGDRTGTLLKVSGSANEQTMDNVVVAYPYSDYYSISLSTGGLVAFLPAEQTYMADSYGVDGNIMVSQSEYKQFVLKSVCGWVKIQLTGNGEKVQSINLKGNNGEQVAGEIYINTADATTTLASAIYSNFDNTEVGGTMLEDNTILTEVALNCGEGVTLGKNATAFYIALPPQEFSKGLTVEVSCSDDSTMTKSTEKEVVIARNTIQPMAAIEYEGKIVVPNNEIWYTSSDGNVVTPNRSDVFGANIVSNTYKNGKGVIKFDDNITSIGDDAFYNCTSLTSVTIGDSVTSIGSRAFEGCTSLTSITIPNSVTEIGDYAFCVCSRLSSVNIPNSVTEIGVLAFYGCTSLTNVTIPDSVTEIGEFAFYGCSSLTSITIPDSVTKIEGSAFAECSSLSSITIPDSVTTIGSAAFNYCTSLTNVTIPDSVTEIGEGAFQYCNSLTSVTIPDSVTSIGEGAFYYCTSLTNVTIPDSVTEIGEFAFYGCSSLTSITIPDGVTSIGNYVFNGCSSLTAFYGKFASADNRCLIIIDGVLSCFAPKGLTEYTIPNSINEIGEYAFFGCKSLTSIIIPDSVTSIGDYAFEGCSSLTSVNIPDSVTEIRYQTFSGCTSLTSVTIPDSATSIEMCAFKGCTSLTSVTIPDNVIWIGFYAFEDCTSLTSVTIGDSVISIGEYTFEDCTSLKEVYCKPITPPGGGTDMFYKNASGRKIYVPRASVDAYKAASRWSDYADDIEPYDFE